MESILSAPGKGCKLRGFSSTFDILKFYVFSFYLMSRSLNYMCDLNFQLLINV